MSDNTYPQPVSDPETDGLPGTADDDSTARDDVHTGREADGPDPAALPLDRDATPMVLDRFGTTPEEAREGESLDLKIGREVNDPALDEALSRADVRPSPISAESFDPDAIAEEVDAIDRDTPLDDGGPVDPRLDSPVSMYDTGVGDGPGRPAGRAGRGPGGGPGGHRGRLRRGRGRRRRHRGGAGDPPDPGPRVR